MVKIGGAKLFKIVHCCLYLTLICLVSEGSVNLDSLFFRFAGFGVIDVIMTDKVKILSGVYNFGWGKILIVKK